jgi:hypothetical protein
MVFHSAEARWFFAGPLPEAMLRWFDPRGRLSIEQRPDQYLLLLGGASVGVKIRHDRSRGKTDFEVKARTGGVRSLSFSPDVTARTDCWTKWRCGDTRLSSLLATTAAGWEGWIEIGKQRRLRHLDLTGPRVAEIEGGGRIAKGCIVELTAVTVEGQPWWSFAFEAFGPADHTRSALSRAASWFIDNDAPPLALPALNSCAYPSWLDVVGRQHAAAGLKRTASLPDLPASLRTG